MAFKRANFQPVGGQSKRGLGGAPAVYSYKTDDTHATVDTAAYFNDVSDIVSIGDLIDVVVVTDLDVAAEAVATYGRHIVLSNAAGVVDVGDVTVGTVTDTD